MFGLLPALILNVFFMRRHLASIEKYRSLSSPINLSFHWGLLDSAGLCGADKCFFRDVRPDYTNVGYLVSRNKREEQSYERQIVQAYELACFLERELGAKHFLLGAPLLLNLTEKEAMALSHNLTNMNAQKRVEDMYTNKHLAVVQPVKVAPEDIMILKGNLDSESLREKLDNWSERNNIVSTSVLARDLQITLDILLDAAPLLAIDFQIMIGGAATEVYQFDFDRFAAGIFHKTFEEIFRKRHAQAVQTVQTALQWAQQPPSLRGKTTARADKQKRSLESSSVSLAASTYQTLSESSADDLTDAILSRYSRSTILFCEEIQTFVDTNFRWKNKTMHPTARTMMMTYVQRAGLASC